MRHPHLGHLSFNYELNFNTIKSVSMILTMLWSCSSAIPCPCPLALAACLSRQLTILFRNYLLILILSLILVSSLSDVLVGRLVIRLFNDKVPKTCENFRCVVMHFA